MLITFGVVEIPLPGLVDGAQPSPEAPQVDPSRHRGSRMVP